MQGWWINKLFIYVDPLDYSFSLFIICISRRTLVPFVGSMWIKCQFLHYPLSKRRFWHLYNLLEMNLKTVQSGFQRTRKWKSHGNNSGCLKQQAISNRALFWSDFYGCVKGSEIIHLLPAPRTDVLPQCETVLLLTQSHEQKCGSSDPKCG